MNSSHLLFVLSLFFSVFEFDISISKSFHSVVISEIVLVLNALNLLSIPELNFLSLTCISSSSPPPPPPSSSSFIDLLSAPIYIYPATQNSIEYGNSGEKEKKKQKEIAIMNGWLPVKSLESEWNRFSPSYIYFSCFRGGLGGGALLYGRGGGAGGGREPGIPPPPPPPILFVI